jgi:hypothetical protein
MRACSDRTNLAKDAGGISDRAAGQRRERAVHHPRRAGQYLGAGTARLASSSTTIWPGAAGARTSLRHQHRIFRLNDYDFGEGNVAHGHLHDLAAIHLRSGIHGDGNLSHSTANEPFNFLNLDLVRAGHLEGDSETDLDLSACAIRTTPIRSIRTTPDRAAAGIVRFHLPRRESAAESGDPNHLGNLFSSTPLAILQPRTAVAWQFAPDSVLRTGFGVFSDLLPGSVADAVGVNPPYVQDLSRRLLGTVGGTAIAPGVPGSAIDAVVAANQSFRTGFPQGQLSCASAQANPATCLPPVAITAVPDGMLHAPYFMEWSAGIEHQFGTREACARNTWGRAR